MGAVITCPKCKHQFEPTDAFREEVQRELNNKAKEWQLRKEEEYKQKEAQLNQKLLIKDAELNKRLAEEKQRLTVELQTSIQRSVSVEYENKIKLMEKVAADTEERLREARRKELEFLHKEQFLKNREQELELSLQKALLEEREKLSREIRKIEEQKIQHIENEYRLKLAEKEKQLEDQRKLAEEMKRKAEQGSMQLQGEVQEIMLEDILQRAFPFDKIVPVAKGVRGADCIQTICSPFGQECGKIIYESKRTKDFSYDWIEKLKHDMRSQGADIAVIVTQALPKDMEHFGEKDGVYICSFTEVRSLATVLRTSILKVFSITKNQENKGDKMQLLYDYLTSGEFNEQWKAIREGFLNMRISIQRERDAMERLWKAREKELEKVLLNAARIKGSVEGIAGTDTVNLNLLEDPDTTLFD